MPVIATAGALNTNAVNLNALIPRYTVSRSLRFRASASAYLNRTPSASNRQTWTWNGWVKRGTIGTAQQLFGAYIGSGTTDTNYFEISYNSDQLQIAGYSTVYRKTTQVFRDPSAWYHVVVALDTTQATASNRVKLYINGVQVTAFATSNDPALNSNLGINGNYPHGISAIPSNAAYFDGYLAEVNFIDGQALTPTSFGAYDTNGVWQPRRYGGTYGTNGFYLPFSNTTSTTTLVQDSSGNGNNWTPNNISLTAGATYDSMIDSPTNYGDGSVNYNRGNYSTLNPLVRFQPNNSSFSSGNLGVQQTGGASGSHACAISSMVISSGKWYAEFSDDTATYDGNRFGIMNVNNLANYTNSNPYVGWASDGYVIYKTSTNAVKENNGVQTNIGANWSAGAIISIAVDLDNSKIWWRVNGGAWFGGGDPVTGINPVFNIASGITYAFAVAPYNNNGVSSNFGQRPFAYTPPTGYKALNTFNLDNPAIPNPEAHFKTTLWTGTGSNQAISNRNAITQVAFSPALVWNKSRGGGLSNILTDIIRGYPLPFRSQIFTDQTVAAEARTDRLQSFDTEGFTVGTYTDVNLSGNTFVGWQWNANKSNTFNTFGSSSSNTIVNTAAGFSMVVYAGTGSNATVGHGLPKAPNLIISRAINDSGRAWPIYHSSLGSNTTYINTTAAQVIDTTIWTAVPNNTVFSIGTGVDINRNINVNIAYCWTAIPGYSAFGSYVGNGNADGPFVYTGFRPRWLMIKNSTFAGTGWRIFDTSRSLNNVAVERLWAHSTSPELTSSAIDILSNGFKIRDGSLTDYFDYNKSGDTMIYAAFAEMPFKYARAR